MGRGTAARTERQAREQEQRERELAQARLLRRKHWVVFGGVLVLIGLACFAAIQWFLQPLPTDVRGRLHGVRELSFVEGMQEGGGISPVCGCAHPALDSWRGVEFAAREVSLLHRGKPWTQWIVSSAEPEPIGLAERAKVVVAKAYRLKPAGAFDPFALSKHPASAGLEVLDSIDVEAETLLLLTRGELNVSLPGPVPIGAWIPFPGSRVKLASSHSAFPGQPQRPHLIESYPSEVGFWPDSAGDMHPKKPQVYPAGDFLGPDLVIWSDDPEARVVGTAFGAAAPPGTVTAVVVSSSVFSTRIGLSPVAPGYVNFSEQFSLGEPDGYAEYPFDASGMTGEVVLTIEEALGKSDYRSVQRRVDAEPRTWTQIPAHLEFESGRRLPRHWEEERFPPLPDHSGFNVFGPMEQVTFHRVRGALTVGDRNVDLSGSGDLSLDRVERFRNDRNEQLVTAPLATAEESAELQFEARGTVAVNGIAQATARSEYEPLLRLVGLLLGIGGAAIGLLKGLGVAKGREP